MSDNFDLSRVWNAAVEQAAPNLRQYFQHEADRTAQVPAVLDVPVRVVPPPVTIKGDLKFIATFQSDLIYGKRYEEVVQMIMDAFQTAGLEPNPLLPELRIHSLQAWREEVGRPDSDRTTSGSGHPDPREHPGIAAAREHNAIREWERLNVGSVEGRGDQLARDAIAGIHPDGAGGGQEHLADLGEGDADDPDDGR